MNLQEQPSKDCVTPFTSRTAQSLDKRRPRFQRQKSCNKCGCNSLSKNKSSDEVSSLSKLYVKKCFPKAFIAQASQITSHSPGGQGNRLLENAMLSKGYVQSTCIQNTLDSQFIRQKGIQKFNEKLVQVSEIKFNSDFVDESKNNIESLLKKLVFYKQKCQKYQESIKHNKTERENMLIENKILAQQNSRLKQEIISLKDFIDNYMSQDFQSNSVNIKCLNNNSKNLKRQYQIFIEQQSSSKRLFEKKYLEVSLQLQQTKKQNGKLRQDLIRHNQLYNTKLKMMQQKQEFLEKTLSFTKNSLTQLEKDYEGKNIQILQFKRSHQIIHEKDKQIQIIKRKYQNILKMVNSEKKREQAKKIVKDPTQQSNVTSGSKSRHCLQIKSIINNHKQNGDLDSGLIRTKISEKNNPFMNFQFVKISGPKAPLKPNYQISSQMRNRSRSSLLSQTIEKQNICSNIYEDKKSSESSYEMSLLSPNSLQLSPQK